MDHSLEFSGRFIRIFSFADLRKVIQLKPASHKKNKARAVAVLIDRSKIAMIERRRAGRLFYVFPGGGVEQGETFEAAVIRESKEELGLDVQVLRLVAESTFLGRYHYYYLVKAIGGEFGAGKGEELNRSPESTRGSVTPIWLDLADLSRLTVLPERMSCYVSQCVEQGWPDEILHFVESEE